MIGTTVLHYRIIDALGRGGMGEVYRAEDVRLGRVVALKFLPESLEANPDRRMRLLREAQAVSRLSSPHIATLHDIGEHDGRLFIVMELVRGEPLSARIERGPVSPGETVRIGAQVARALAEAHEHGVVHRDVKPSNVMVTGDGYVKVLDFGLAKFLEVKGTTDDLPTVVVPDQTSPGMILGTVHYMSPEQALGHQVDHRTDIFSLGVVLYEMLAGARPFHGRTVTQTIDAIVHAAPPPIRPAAPGVSAALERVVLRALEKEPARRQQTAAGLAAELEAAAPSGAVAASYETRADSGLAAAAAAAGRAPRRASSVAVMAFANIRREPSDDWIGSGIAETVTSDLKYVGGLSVIGRERVTDALKALAPGGAEEDETIALRIGNHVGATWIVAGAFQHLGDALRVTARFLDVSSGTVVRTIKVDGTLPAIFDLQDRIVRELVDGLDLELARSELDAIERNETNSIQAYEKFSRGLAELRVAEPEAFDRAIGHLMRAVELDGGYANAWAWLGAAYSLKGQFLSQRNLVLEALDFERKALHLDPANVTAHEWLGSALNYLGRVDEAVASFETAVRLDPGYASAHAGLGRVHWLGRGDVRAGIASLERATQLDPNLGYAYLQLAFLHSIEGDFERAAAAALRAVALQERAASGTLGLRLVGARARLGYVYYRMGRYEEAIAEYEREAESLAGTSHALRERTSIELDQKLGAAYLRRGSAADAAALLARSVERARALFGDRPPDAATAYYLACAHALRGEVEPALERLALAAAQLPTITPVRAASDPDLASLRGHEAFDRLVAGAASASDPDGDARTSDAAEGAGAARSGAAPASWKDRTAVRGRTRGAT